MLLPRSWVVTALLAAFSHLSPAMADVADEIQIALAHDQPHATNDSAIVEDLSDLFQSGIWLGKNDTAASEHCCNILSTALPGQVFFPDSLEYQTQQASHFSTAQANIKPSCRVSPVSAEDISAIVTLAAKHDCAFAVRSGGHGIAHSYSNAGAPGFTIDLQKMNQVSLLEGQGIVSFGAGCRWHEVYSVLEPYNLTTTGARALDVGVSGFLLGGGISFLSHAHGFASSNIVNYQVVLADGAIHEVNSQSLPDLYWALKYGSTNFAIVTRFDLRTYPLSDVWGGLLVFDVTHAPTLLQFLVGFNAKLVSDPTGWTMVSLAWDSAQGTYIAGIVGIYLSPVPFPPLHADLKALVPHAHVNTVRITNEMSVMKEMADRLPSGQRTHWFTLTLHADATLMADIYHKGVESFEPYLEHPGFSWSVLFQPINHGFARAGHPAGLSPEDGNLILVLILAFWSEPGEDEIMKQKVHEHGTWAENVARARGLLHPFIYMNYASELQDVIGSIETRDFLEMRRVKSLYDPEDWFGVHWKGGFKL
ncbi:hypothetical protein B0H11DRAFT_2173241 [Mycena galericulata]|nr:hypothetical protein B0H11DRAFT_2173241 [Mycena galericulata]